MPHLSVCVMRSKSTNFLVLVGVIRRQKDLDIAIKKHWYRIPLKYAPRRFPAYIAFYQTRTFGKEGKVLRYYAPVKSSTVVQRIRLLPDEKEHPRADKYYYKFRLGKVRRTPRIIHNDSRRRVSFGFTTVEKLRKSERICQLFDIVPLEDIMRKSLRKRKLSAVHEYCVMEDGRCRYRLDFAIFCKHGKIALECDNEKWHLTPKCRVGDRERDRYLKRCGWVVLRLPGRDIKESMNDCLRRVEKAVNRLGGILRNKSSQDSS